MKIDVLAIGAHPDDIELTCAGTLMVCMSMGAKAGILDCTAGEMGTRGSAKIRLREAARSAKILGLDFRENLHLTDGYLKVSDDAVEKVVNVIRKIKPRIIITFYERDHHPDHVACSKIVARAHWLSGVPRYLPGVESHRAKALVHFAGKNVYQPSFAVDVSGFFKMRMKAIKCFKSQLYNPKSREPDTTISNPQFLEWIEARARYWGSLIGTTYAEPFYFPQILPVKNPLMLWN
ncbi:MAG: bacillithiol biosynthesis deacetylase BshB1 [bacterium]